MDELPSEFGKLMERVRAGCPEAAQEVYNRYANAVRRVVRCRLSSRVRRHFDSHDVSQSVWASFFDEPIDRYCFANPEELIAFLARVAYNKVVDKTRHVLGARRDVRREVSLDSPRPGHGELDEGNPLAVVLPAERSPTPSQYVMADERWQKLTRNLPAGHVRILEMILEGHTQVDIARRMGCDRKVIQRLLDRLEEIAFGT
jgi:DNA-directed RNA polymerase specialized sigma24 family protein